MTFCSAVPIINSGIIRDGLSYFKENKKIKEKLGGVEFVKIPIYAPQNFVNSTKKTFCLMHCGTSRALKKIILDRKINIVHCRSYHSAWAAIRARERYNLKIKIVFDARGIWPEEVALKKSQSYDSKDYIFLKKIEKKILAESDVVISVSDTMHKYYEELGGKRFEKIYLSAKTKLFSTAFSDIKDRTSGDMVFGYVGALSDSTWHKPYMLRDLFQILKSINKNSRLVIVTGSDFDEIKKYFPKELQDSVSFFSTKTTEALVEILKQFDFGLISYFSPDNDQEKKLSEMVLSVKVVEYMSAGLPVIVNKYCKGAADLIDRYGFGFSYDPVALDALKAEDFCSFKYNALRMKIVDFARNNFDYEVNAKKYLEIYMDLE